jgi:uncharacterized protein YjbI with pentapeptide repeats
MAYKEQLKILKRSVLEWNAGRVGGSKEFIDLIFANLREANLRGADLRGTHATVAYLLTSDREAWYGGAPYQKGGKEGTLTCCWIAEQPMEVQA